MSEPTWLTEEVVLAIQRELLTRFGGLAGVRDRGLLESALARPRQLFAYGQPSLAELAAAYARGLAKNHPLLDGNKRVAFMAAYTFLGLNDKTLIAPQSEVVSQTLALAAGDISEADYAAWLDRNCQPAG